MPRKPSARVVVNREAVEAIRLGWADGLQEVGERIIARTAPTYGDAPPLGKGLRKSGRAVTYVDGKKVAGTGTAPRGWAPKVIGTVFGFGFPGRFYEVGTVRQPARPRLTPATITEVDGGAGGTVATAIEARLQRVRK